MTSPADSKQPTTIDDTDPGWLADLSEWMSYYWKRLHQHEAATWPPPWGPSALAIAGMAVLVLIVGGLLVPLVRGFAGFVINGAEWTRSTAAADIVLQPVRQYIDAHAAGLPITSDTLWWTWCAAGIVLCLTSTLTRSLAAQLGWVLYGAASVAMVYNASSNPARPVAAAVAALWWIGFSFLALRRRSSSQDPRTYSDASTKR
ncbi:hypothetical protein [Actinoplanes subglobosus]|uniref:Transmembrane protein n=1 Tax=Actinoplanes subglobosus TaxID=1547892 RepID=A0ABV8IM73_9ACTN